MWQQSMDEEPSHTAGVCQTFCVDFLQAVRWCSPICFLHYRARLTWKQMFDWNLPWKLWWASIYGTLNPPFNFNDMVIETSFPTPLKMFKRKCLLIKVTTHISPHVNNKWVEARVWIQYRDILRSLDCCRLVGNKYLITIIAYEKRKLLN